ncbi:hypothetical protein SDC9_178091 [bioreactor metagenome]|uniref:Uncharacterized protein n=1 Tax=bioreactor metagenome TaxID=1076179 RepID=A0A645GW90_9ZZZZ
MPQDDYKGKHPGCPEEAQRTGITQRNVSRVLDAGRHDQAVLLDGNHKGQSTEDAHGCQRGNEVRNIEPGDNQAVDDPAQSTEQDAQQDDDGDRDSGKADHVDAGHGNDSHGRPD